MTQSGRVTRVLLAVFAATIPFVASALSGEAELQAQRENALPVSEFYQTPKPLPAGEPGTLIRSEAVDLYHLPPGVSSRRIAYLSRSALGQPVMTTAVVLIPFGQPPKGGWPVVAWAHGTSGFARGCAPSLMKDLYYGWEGLFEYPMLGYAVVATDYAGLGTEGAHQYMSYEGLDHDPLVYASLRDQIAWIGARFEGRTAKTNCAAR